MPKKAKHLNPITPEEQITLRIIEEKLMELENTPITECFTRRQIDVIRELLTIEETTFGELSQLLTELREEFERESKKEKGKFDYLRQGEKLCDRYIYLEWRYLGRTVEDDGFSLCIPSLKKEEFIDVIDDHLAMLGARLDEFDEPDYTRTGDNKLDETKLEIKEWQNYVMAQVPGKSYAQIRALALRYYGRLENDFRTFRIEIGVAPDEVFES